MAGEQPPTTRGNVFTFALAIDGREVRFCILSGQPDAARGGGDGWLATALNLADTGFRATRNDRDRWPTRAAAVGDCVAWIIQGLRDQDAGEGGY